MQKIPPGITPGGISFGEENGIRTHGPPFGSLRFSRPAQSASSGISSYPGICLAFWDNQCPSEHRPISFSNQTRISASRHKCSKNLVTKLEFKSELIRLIAYSACSKFSPYGVPRPKGTTMRGSVRDASGSATESSRDFTCLISAVSPTAISKSREG